MVSKKLIKQFIETKKKFPYLTKENYFRILLLINGINFQSLDSYPDNFTRQELIFSIPEVSNIPVLTLLNPNSSFKIFENSDYKTEILFYENEYVCTISDLEITSYNLNNIEPFYFFVKEINGDLVLKINPIQMCNFFQSSEGSLPCIFCFRNDMVSRFNNINAKNIINLIKAKEKLNKFKYLNITDEISLITGSYRNDKEYFQEISAIIQGIKPYVPKKCRIVVGSHEVKMKENYVKLKRIGVTDYAFSIESLDDTIRKKYMKNRKGIIPVSFLIENIKDAIDVFGEDKVIIRLVIGIGDRLDDNLKRIVQLISNMGKTKKGPRWNINIFMPFTHWHWRIFKEKPFFDINYLFEYISILNHFVKQDKFYRFKISP